MYKKFLLLGLLLSTLLISACGTVKNSDVEDTNSVQNVDSIEDTVEIETTEAYIAPTIAEYTEANVEAVSEFESEYSAFKEAFEHYKEVYPDQEEFIATCDAVIADIEEVKANSDMDFNSGDVEDYINLFHEFRGRMNG